MARSLIEDQSPERQEEKSKPRRYRFEMGRFQLFLCCLGLVMTLSWMFVFGVLVGRGTSLVSPGDVSLQAIFLRFLGLDRRPPPPAENVAQTWEDQKKMLESLNYYQDLTQKPSATGLKSPPPDLSARMEPQPKIPSPDTGDSKQTPQKPPADTPETPHRGAPEKSVQPAIAPTFPPPDEGTEHFTLLISSLRDSENAQKLLEQLRSKGYPARIETLDLSGSRWNRVLVGSFRNRSEALQFSAEFNRREKMEGLVIRESR